MVFHLHTEKNRVARNFCGSLFLQICDFLRFVGTDFCLLAVFQIRDGSWVNDPTKKASWPER